MFAFLASFPPKCGREGVQDDGKVLIGGLFTAIDSTLRNRIARLHGEFVEVYLPLVLRE